MKLPATQASELMGDHFPWIDRYFLESVPQGVELKTSETICIISEWLNEPTYYANRTFKGWTIGVEVHIFYELNSPMNTLDEEMKIAQLFVADGWTIENSRNHSKDPDTQQVDKVFYFAKNLVIKESDK